MTDNRIIVRTGPRRATSGLKCESVALDAEIIGESRISNNDGQRVSFGGLSEQLVASPIVTIGLGNETSDRDELKLLIQSDPFFSWTILTV